jgi:hypothetical protein
MKREKRKPVKRDKPKKETPPDLCALVNLLRDRKPRGGWIESGRNVRLKGAGGIG